MKIAGIAILPVLAAAMSLSAAESGDQTAAQADLKKDKVICKTERGGGIGARSKRICMTRAQWDELAAKSRKGADQAGRTGADACRQQSAQQMTSPCN